ncbi:hypothetical protein FHX56_007545 [Paraburkholderia tropica]|nr:hypothetical protein [Paraburkholderia tropica]
MTCNWKEGGDSRAELHAAGGALIGGLGGEGRVHPTFAYAARTLPKRCFKQP